MQPIALRVSIGCLLLGAGMLLAAPLMAFATSGACSYHGGVDCAAGPGIYGQVICNDGWTDSSVSYDSMVECGGGYYSPPSCPIFSSYDSLSGSCKCNYGYVASGDQCISQDEACQNQLGYESQYNILNNTCECNSGYIIQGGTCVNANNYCWNNFGYGSEFNSLSKQCECSSGYQFDSSSEQCVSAATYCENTYGSHAESDYAGVCKCQYGYVLNSTKDTCISGDDYCQAAFGNYATYDSLSNTCGCQDGYEMTNGQCQEVPVVSDQPVPIIENNYPTTYSPTPTPTPAPAPKPKPIIKKAPVVTPLPPVQIEATTSASSSVTTATSSATTSTATTTNTQTASQVSNDGFLARFWKFLTGLFSN